MRSEKAIGEKDKLLVIKKYLQSYAMVIALLIIWLIFEIITGGTFLGIRNISNLFRQMVVVSVLSLGMAICLIAGNFDLSVGSVTGFLGAVAAYLVTNATMNSALAVIIAILIGGVIGCWNGMWVAYGKVPAFIATLGSSLIFKGGLFFVTQGTTIPVNDALFFTLGQEYVSKYLGYIICVGAVVVYIIVDVINKSARGRYMVKQQKLAAKSHVIQSVKYAIVVIIVGMFAFIMNSYEGIPISVLLMLILVFGFAFILSKTRFGRHVYAVGGNPRASQFSGINNSRTVLLTFTIMGLLTGLAGVLTTARLSAATPAAGIGLELDAVAASVIGGVSLFGGSGKVTNSIIGALVMASLTNGMSLLNMNSDLQYIVKGMILILAVWFDVGIRKPKSA
jgi:D-xylose transport system permease protein